MLLRFIEDADSAADNNRSETLIYSDGRGGTNLLFTESLRAQARAAAITRVLHSARLNRHGPSA